MPTVHSFWSASRRKSCDSLSSKMYSNLAWHRARRAYIRPIRHWGRGIWHTCPWRHIRSFRATTPSIGQMSGRAPHTHTSIVDHHTSSIAQRRSLLDGDIRALRRSHDSFSILSSQCFLFAPIFLGTIGVIVIGPMTDTRQSVTHLPKNIDKDGEG
jgi:hypothetical protein